MIVIKHFAVQVPANIKTIKHHPLNLTSEYDGAIVLKCEDEAMAKRAVRAARWAGIRTFRVIVIEYPGRVIIAVK